MKKILLLCTVFIILPICLSAKYIDERTYHRAEIKNIIVRSIKMKKNMPVKLFKTEVTLEILEGKLKGQVKKATFGGQNGQPADMNYKIGDTVFIGITKASVADKHEYISIYDIDNSNSIILLIIITVLAIVFIGKLKGLASLGALLITMMLLFFLLIPLTLKGYAPLPLAVIISIVSILITLPIIAGLRLKTLGAILGASGGIIFSSFLAIATSWIIHLSGIIKNDMLTVFYASNVKIDLKGLVLSGMIIAALGAIMDVCISIASATNEIFEANPKIEESQAFKSVLNIGTDILGSMVNTLILAYVGSSLSLILLIAMKLKPGMPFWMVLNYNPVLSEIVKSIIGSLGMFLSIPLTAFITVKLYKNKFSTEEKKS